MLVNEVFSRHWRDRKAIARYAGLTGSPEPDEVVPGNNMKPYGGLTSAEDRAKVIVFLERSLPIERLRHVPDS